MFKFIQKQLKNKKGFTLVELVVVIAILGILAAIAVPRLGASRETAANTAHEANIRTLISAGNMFIADEGVPTTSSVIWNPAGGTKASTISESDLDVDTNAWAKYLQEWPKAPTGLNATDYPSVSGNNYVVTIETNGNISVTNPSSGD